jgi:hypothetical protein
LDLRVSRRVGNKPTHERKALFYHGGERYRSINDSSISPPSQLMRLQLITHGNVNNGGRRFNRDRRIGKRLQRDYAMFIEEIGTFCLVRDMDVTKLADPKI